MTELQFRILERYYKYKELDSYKFYWNFQRSYREYTLKEVEREMSYLHASLFLDSKPDKFHTLHITPLGEQKYEIEKAALDARNRFRTQEPQFQNPIFEITMKDQAIIDAARERQLREAGLIPGMETRLPDEKPINQTKAERKVPVFKKAIKSVWEFINANIVSSIIGGLVVAFIIYKITVH